MQLNRVEQMLVKLGTIEDEVLRRRRQKEQRDERRNQQKQVDRANKATTQEHIDLVRRLRAGAEDDLLLPVDSDQVAKVRGCRPCACPDSLTLILFYGIQWEDGRAAKKIRTSLEQDVTTRKEIANLDILRYGAWMTYGRVVEGGPVPSVDRVYLAPFLGLKIEA